MYTYKPTEFCTPKSKSRAKAIPWQVNSRGTRMPHFSGMPRAIRGTTLCDLARGWLTREHKHVAPLMPRCPCCELCCNIGSMASLRHICWPPHRASSGRHHIQQFLTRLPSPILRAGTSRLQLPHESALYD